MKKLGKHTQKVNKQLEELEEEHTLAVLETKVEKFFV